MLKTCSDRLWDPFFNIEWEDQVKTLSRLYSFYLTRSKIDIYREWVISALRTLGHEYVQPVGEITGGQINEILDALAAGGENIQPLPANFSREDIYYDHD